MEEELILIRGIVNPSVFPKQFEITIKRTKYGGYLVIDIPEKTLTRTYVAGMSRE